MDPTGDNTITLPNASGTVSLVSATEILSNKTFASSFSVNGASEGTTIIQAASSAGGTLTLPTSGGTIAVTGDLGNSEMLIIMQCI